MPNYRYRLVSTKASSAKYGPCEVCNEHCSEVFSQTEERQYATPGSIDDILEDPEVYKGGQRGWTQNDCHSYYGHHDCLIGKRRS